LERKMLGAALNFAKGLTGWAFKGTVAAAGTGAAVLGGQAAIAAQTGERTWFNQGMEYLGKEVADASAGMEAEGMWSGIYNFFEYLGEMVMNLTNGQYGEGLKDWAVKAQNGGVEVENAAVDPTAVSPSMPEGVTSENALTLDNFRDGVENISEVDLLHKANVLAHGAAEGVVQVGSLFGHAYDGLDTFSGWVVGGIGGEGARDWWGDRERDASQAIYDNGMWAVDAGFDATVGVPELQTAWDRALHFGGEVAGASVTGFGIVSKLGAAFPAVAGAGAAGTTGTGASMTAGTTGSWFSRVANTLFSGASTTTPARAAVATPAWTMTGPN
jgi:hypothetical protein